MKTVRDLNGNELRMVLLQILDKDQNGPILLRARRDGERIDLSEEKRNSFLMVYAPVDQTLGEVWLNQLVEGFEQLKEEHAKRVEASDQLQRDIDNIQREWFSLEAENKTKTEALRQLQKERDPDRIDAIVKAAVNTRTAVLDAQLAKARADIVDRDREITELKASKKKLKEANERLKEGKR